MPGGGWIFFACGAACCAFAAVVNSIATVISSARHLVAMKGPPRIKTSRDGIKTGFARQAAGSFPLLENGINILAHQSRKNISKSDDSCISNPEIPKSQIGLRRSQCCECDLRFRDFGI